MPIEQMPSPISFTCKLLLDVRTEIEETEKIQREDVRLIVGADAEPLPKLTSLRSRLRANKSREQAVRVYCAGFETHATRLTELRASEEKLVKHINDEAHRQLLESNTEYSEGHDALRAPVQLLQHLDHAAMLGRRACELITRAEVHFKHDVATGMYPSVASTEAYVWAANAAVGRLVTELHCGLTPLLRAHGETVDPWDLLPDWDSENNRVGYSKRYHLVGWCLERSSSFTDPQKGLVTGVTLADKRLAEYRALYRAAEATRSASLRTTRNHLIGQWLEAAKTA